MKNPVIFVVDKNPIHRNLIKYRLESNKLTNIQVFPSGEECIYRLQKNQHPDFLITSFFTGSHDGFDFLRVVHGISPLIRLIFFDNFEDHLVARKLIEAGASDYISKTRNPETGISELIKNLRYIARDVLVSGLN